MPSRHSCGLLWPLVAQSQIAAPAWTSVFAWAIGAALGWLAWETLSPGMFVVAFLLIGAALLIGTWLVVPPSLQVVARAGRRQWITIPAWRQFPWLPVLSSALSRLLFTGAVLIWLPDSWLLLTLMVPFAAVECRRRTRWLYGLPFSHRALLNITLLAAVVPFITCLSVGLWLRLMESPGVGTNVPLEYWEWAPGGHVPLTRAPWGETARPATLRALGLTFYNPYSTGSGNTDQMVLWQHERAQRAVYGQLVPAGIYSTKAEYRRAKAELIPYTQRPRIRVLMVEAATFYALLLVLATELCLWHRVRRYHAAAIAIVMLPFLAAYAVGVYYLKTSSIELLPGLLRFALLHLDRAMPSAVLAATVAALPLLATYWLLDRQFRKSEVRQSRDPVQSA